MRCLGRAVGLSEGDHRTGRRNPAAFFSDEEFLVWSFGPGQQWLGAYLSMTSCLFSSFPPAGIISEQGLREEVPPILQHHILKVALELPASKFLWLKAQVGN